MSKKVLDTVETFEMFMTPTFSHKDVLTKGHELLSVSIPITDHHDNTWKDKGVKTYTYDGKSCGVHEVTRIIPRVQGFTIVGGPHFDKLMQSILSDYPISKWPFVVSRMVTRNLSNGHVCVWKRMPRVLDEDGGVYIKMLLVSIDGVDLKVKPTKRNLKYRREQYKHILDAADDMVYAPCAYKDGHLATRNTVCSIDPKVRRLRAFD